jgi:anthranilate/para-aminobenzoate synthase component II
LTSTVAQTIRDTKMFSGFPASLLTDLKTKAYAFHAHDYVVSRKAFAESQQLSDFFKIVATDSHDNKTFVTAVESRNYPISGVMFHPETQTISVIGTDRAALAGKVNNADTDAIMLNFSRFVKREAMKGMNTGLEPSE